MILFTQWARNMALIASFATGLFNAALRALLNRPVAQLAHRAIFVPIAFTIIDYSFNIRSLYIEFPLYMLSSFVINDSPYQLYSVWP